MSRFDPWNNVTKDRREQKHDNMPQGTKGHAASGEMKAVVDAATGSPAGQWPTSAPLVSHDGTKKEQV